MGNLIRCTKFSQVAHPSLLDKDSQHKKSKNYLYIQCITESIEICHFIFEFIRVGTVPEKRIQISTYQIITTIADYKTPKTYLQKNKT